MSLDIEEPGALAAYLTRTGRAVAGEIVAVRRLAGGVSNRTMLVELSGQRSWVLKQALPKLRVEVDWFSPPERIHREALALRHVAILAPADSVPPFIFEDETEHVLAMGAVPEPHRNWKTALLAGEINPEHFAAFGIWLGSVHRGGMQHSYSEIFRERSYFESLRLEPYYEYSAQQVPEAAEFLTELCRTTRARRVTLVHGDYSPKNVILQQDRLILLDYEVIHFGDPGFDLGFSLCHMLSKAHHMPLRRAEMAKMAGVYWAAYCDAFGSAENEARGVLHTLGCLLARVAGRSPLEYMHSVERARQRRAAVALMACPPQSVPGLIDGFLEKIECL